MSVESALAAGRAAAERRMTSRATIYREGVTTIDDDGFEVEGWGVIEQNIPCRLAGSRSGSSATRTVTVGDVETQVALRVLHLPASTTTLQQCYAKAPRFSPTTMKRDSSTLLS